MGRLTLWKPKNDIEVILRAKSNFQTFNPAAITAEGLTSKPSRALLRHKNIYSKTKISKNRKRQGLGR